MLQKRIRLPVIDTENGVIDLNDRDNRDMITYHRGTSSSLQVHPSTYVGGPEEFEEFLREASAEAE